MALNLNEGDFQRLMKRFDKLEEVAEESDELLEDAAIELLALTKAEAPVKTGRLRDSIEAERIKGGYSVEVKADYGVYVEMGTRYTRAQPFWYHNVRKVIEELRSTILNRLKIR